MYVESVPQYVKLIFITKCANLLVITNDVTVAALCSQAMAMISIIAKSTATAVYY